MQRQRKLDLARAKRIKVRIDKKEIQARALAEREKHLQHARAKLKRETRIFKRDVQSLVDESVRTSNWGVEKQSQLFEGVGQEGVNETSAKQMASKNKGKPWQKPSRKAGSPRRQLALIRI